MLWSGAVTGRMMPLSKTNELNLIMNENAKLTVEHSGAENVSYSGNGS